MQTPPPLPPAKKKCRLPAQDIVIQCLWVGPINLLHQVRELLG